MPENTTPDNAPTDPDLESTNPDTDGPSQPSDLDDSGSLTVEDTPFAIVPEWVITTPITDAAFRVYALLLRYGGTSGCRMPSRALLARRLHKSVDTIDRALRELSGADIVRIEHRHDGHHYTSNRYHLRTTDPSKPAADRSSVVATPQTATGGGSRTDAATPSPGTPAGTQTNRTNAGTPSRTLAATPSRRSAARVAAKMRPYPEVPTQRKPPPPATPPAASVAAPTASTAALHAAAAVVAACGITDLDALTARCIAARNALGQPTGRWTPNALALAIQLAVTHRGWPPSAVTPALLAVTADPATRSPVRLAEAGPWWDTPTATGTEQGDGNQGGDDHASDLEALEARLAETGGRRPALQAQARAQLRDEALPVTRTTVTRRSVQILDRPQAFA